MKPAREADDADILMVGSRPERPVRLAGRYSLTDDRAPCRQPRALRDVPLGRRIESARGPHFLPGCWGLRPEGYHSDLDAAYPRYPLLPVQACTGFEVLDPSFPLRHNSGEGAEG